MLDNARRTGRCDATVGIPVAPQRPFRQSDDFAIERRSTPPDSPAWITTT
jgi:hypothetical protein